MKIDRTKLKRSSSEVPADCKALIDKLKNCNQEQLLNELRQIKSWTCGKCELYHWVDLLDVFDDILGECCAKQHDNQWTLPCDSPNMDPRKKELLMHIISFTALLIEHSFSRHLYSSMDHLITLLSSSDMQIVLSVLSLLFVFSKRSNFIGKLSIEKRQELLTRLSYLAESWGGKENGFGLAECCRDLPMSAYPSSATTLHFEYYTDQASVKNLVQSQSTSSCTEPNVASRIDNVSAAMSQMQESQNFSSVSSNNIQTTNLCPTPQSYSQALRQPRRTLDINPLGSSSSSDYVSDKKSISVIHIDNVDQIKGESIANIMERLVATYNVPRDKQMQLFTHLRLAHCFSDHVKRMQCVQARLQAMSIIIYCAPATTQEIGTQLLYNGFIEELVDILQLEGHDFIDIKSAALRTLTSVVHLDRNSRLSTIIDATETSSYHGFLPVLVRNCIQSLINDDNKFPIPYATALFSFLYHLASYEKGGEALVSCGMMESLLKIISWRGTELEHITFVTRSVRVIDLITNIDMTVFQSQSGLNIFVERLENEIKICRKELCDDNDDVEMNQTMDETSSDSQQPMDVDSPKTPTNLSNNEMNNDESQSSNMPAQSAAPQHSKVQQNPPVPRDIQCYTQRAALLKSMLNFLKKAIQDSTFSDCIRHLMDGSLPKSLRHIISNASYYGSSLFLLSIELVSVYVFQEPALLSSLQESQLTKDILDAILDKPLPPTREILAALPNTFSALCLNNAGLQAFQARKPFEKIFRVLISPEYLPAMRRRKADIANDTATNLGNSMDELMRHQPSLRADVVSAIINLLKELCELGDNPTYTCCTKISSKSVESTANPVNIDIRSIQQNNTINETAVFTDDEDEDDEDSASPPVGSNRDAQAAIKSPAKPPVALQTDSVKVPVPLVDYILNVMRFVDAILTNNSTDDHVREFLRQDGLVPLLRLMRLKNLPIDFPNTQACGGISSVCRSILALARDPKVVQEALRSLDGVLDELQVLHKPLASVGGSVLLEEYGQIASNTNISDPVVLSNLTPLLHSMSAAHAYVVMFCYINRSNHLETRNICINHWGKDRGLEVLKKMSRLYMALVWESTVLINITKPTIPQVNFKSAQPPSTPNENYGIAQLDRLPVISMPNENDNEELQQQQQTSVQTSSNQTIEFNETKVTTTKTDSTQTTSNMDVDDTSKSSTSERKSKSKGKKLPFEQSKLIKPLLVSTSRLGKGLAELFALLVKLSVGSPLRHRRNNHSITNTPSVPSAAAQNISSVFAKLIADGLSWDIPSSLPKHK
jgi:E3 ubiquitin-protein ligase HUWE1